MSNKHIRKVHQTLTAAVAAEICTMRIARDLTQEQLAAAIDVDRTTIVRWETQHGLPTLDNLLDLISYFDLSLAECCTFAIRLAIAAYGDR